MAALCSNESLLQTVIVITSCSKRCVAGGLRAGGTALCSNKSLLQTVIVIMSCSKRCVAGGLRAGGTHMHL